MLVIEPALDLAPLPVALQEVCFSKQAEKALERAMSSESPVDQVQIFQDIFKGSEFIVATFDTLTDVIATPLIESFLADVQTVIVDDAHSQLEPETLLCLSSLNPA